jgi:hypothetical protein
MVERGDCGAAAGELGSMVRDGPGELIRAGLQMQEIQELQQRLEQIVIRMRSRC